MDDDGPLAGDPIVGIGCPTVDVIPVGEGKRGPITRRLQKKFLQLAHPGEDEDLTTPAIG